MADLSKGVGRYDLSQFKGPSAIAQGGATMRGAFTGLGNKIMGAIAEPGLKREADAKTAKIQEFVTKYNNPNDADFAGMQGSQRALKLSRLLLPIDPAMSDEWSKRSFAMAQEEKSSGMDLEKLKQKGLTDIELKNLDVANKSPEIPSALVSRLSMLDSILNGPDIGKKTDADVKLLKDERNRLSNQIAQLSPEIAPSFKVEEDKPLSTVESIDWTAKISAEAKDANKDGVMDNKAQLIRSVEEWADKNNIRRDGSEVSSIIGFINNIEDQMKKTKDASVSENERSREQAKTVTAQEKDQFGAFKESTASLNKTIAAGIALGQAMKDAIEIAISNGQESLNTSDSQKLAALSYQTYNPGTLVAGEMTEAINAAKGGSASTQAAKNALSAFGFKDNKIPIANAIEIMNSSLNASKNAYRDYLRQSNQFSQAFPNSKLLKSYNLGLIDPSFYTVGGPQKQQDKIPAKVGNLLNLVTRK